MIVNDAEEEAALVIGLVREIVWRGPRSRHNDLDLGQREACLLEVRTILAQDDLPLVLILLIRIKQCVRDDCVVICATWLLTLRFEARSRGYDHVLVVTSPLYIHDKQVCVLGDRPIDRQNAIRVHRAKQKPFLRRDKTLALVHTLHDSIDVSCLLDLERVGHDGLVVREADNIQIAEHLAHGENIISGEMKSSDVRLLHRQLAHFFEVGELVYHD